MFVCKLIISALFLKIFILLGFAFHGYPEVNMYLKINFLRFWSNSYYVFTIYSFQQNDPTVKHTATKSVLCALDETTKRTEFACLIDIHQASFSLVSMEKKLYQLWSYLTFLWLPVVILSNSAYRNEEF